MITISTAAAGLAGRVGGISQFLWMSSTTLLAQGARLYLLTEVEVVIRLRRSPRTRFPPIELLRYDQRPPVELLERYLRQSTSLGGAGLPAKAPSLPFLRYSHST